MRTQFISSDKKSASAFSLPELVIAVGICTLGLLSLLGLIPQSLDSIRKAGEVSAESRIAQKIFAGISMSDWQSAQGTDQLETAYHGKRYCFDDLAVELEKPVADLDVAFVAEVSVAPLDVSLPQTSAKAVAADPHLRRVTVKVATTGSENFNFAQANTGSYRSYASIISRSGK